MVSRLEAKSGNVKRAMLLRLLFVGLVFLLLGAFWLPGGLLPGDLDSASVVVQSFSLPPAPSFSASDVAGLVSTTEQRLTIFLPSSLSCWRWNAMSFYFRNSAKAHVFNRMDK